MRKVAGRNGAGYLCLVLRNETDNKNLFDGCGILIVLAMFSREWRGTDGRL